MDDGTQTPSGTGFLGFCLFFGASFGALWLWLLCGSWPWYFQIPYSLALFVAWLWTVNAGFKFDAVRITRREDSIARNILRHALHENSRVDFVLFLRPFELDSGVLSLVSEQRVSDPYDAYRWVKKARWNASELRKRHQPSDLIDVLQHSVIGTCICVGTRKKDLLRVGVIETNDTDWQRDVGVLLEKARLIVAFPWTTPGVTWELNSIFERFLLKTVFVMPTSYGYRKEKVRRNPLKNYFDTIYLPEEREDQHAARSHRWSDVAQLFQRAGLTLPTYDWEGAMFIYDSNRALRFTRLPVTRTQWDMALEALRG